MRLTEPETPRTAPKTHRSEVTQRDSTRKGLRRPYAYPQGQAMVSPERHRQPSSGSGSRGLQQDSMTKSQADRVSRAEDWYEYVALFDYTRWSLYGGPWLQPMATGGKSPPRETGTSKPKPLPSVATACRKERMVRRGSPRTSIDRTEPNAAPDRCACRPPQATMASTSDRGVAPLPAKIRRKAYGHKSDGTRCWPRCQKGGWQ
jgi:hypothetical protein